MPKRNHLFPIGLTHEQAMIQVSWVVFEETGLGYSHAQGFGGR